MGRCEKGRHGGDFLIIDADGLGALFVITHGQTTGKLEELRSPGQDDALRAQQRHHDVSVPARGSKAGNIDDIAAPVGDDKPQVISAC